MLENVMHAAAPVAPVPTPDIPTPAMLLDRARSLVPILREREAAAGLARQVSAETIRDFTDAGFFRVLQPARFGGYEMDPAVYCGIARILAEGCMSSAWVYGVVAVHNWQLALFPPQAAEDVWGTDSDVRISSSYMPCGKVTRVEGGYRLSGRWAFSSGSAHCDWAILGVHIPAADGGAPDPCNFLVPRSDYTIIDTWDVMGLCATGSNDIMVEDAFVPDHRIIREMDMFAINCPGHAVHQSSLYQIPFAQLFNRTVSTTSLGSLKRALDVFVEGMRTKRATYTGVKLANDSAIQEAVADVVMTLDDLDMRLARDLAELSDRAQRRDWSDERRAALGLSTTSMVSRCVTAIDQIMLFSGGKAIYRGNVVQRAFLDIHCARAHVANNPYPYARNFGAMAFGAANDCYDI
ncbi:flavin-dependent monooxygenase [Sphingobium sp. HBC34]|uniref:Flavin-dependent monooxygenase n=1 Tax=Sphingobium cyanobacteriorum TaxID=3063954 RepID=A0ABT8ZM98_9SPHN|nr:acyl-CoA dehydrogenase family protein [Sphingobium sp. HBC34]MDO7835518.1 flavin-dependent monooxygenase [Sphingobium sp. HBC34]